MKKTALLAPLLLSIPLVASAQNLSNITTLVAQIGNIVNMLIPILIAVALLVFFWGLIKYIRGSGEGHDTGKNIMLAGLVSLFIMVSVWGIIRFAQNALGIQGNSSALQLSPRIY